ncbi:MAG TPA: ATP-binding cassette domain-containing protein, partial [Streptosporangiaceae bacterium]|nr:ATP-binding cassette domain-containing protein [Streptosporangiaceae bacterium]
MTGAPLLETRGLSKTFVSRTLRSRSSVRAVDDVSFAVLAGQAVGLVGESGSGKSTVARLIARLERPTAGQILLDGRDVIAAERHRASRAYRHQVQMIFQDPFSSLNPTHTVGYHLRRSVRIHGTAGDLTRDEAVQAVLRDVRLDSVPGIADRYPHELSGGQRQRV